MSAVWQFFVHIYAFLAALPFLTFAAIWLVLLFLYQEKKKAFGLSVDIITFFLIGSVSAMYDQIFHSALNGVWLILLILLLLAGILASLQNRKNGSIDGKRIFHAVWRIGFLALGFFYILFSIILIIKHIRAV